MATIVETLRTINAYPIPAQALATIATSRGLTPDAEFEGELITLSAYALAQADVYMWLADAPDVSQGGQSYSFTDEQRKAFRARAISIYGQQEDARAPKSIYGYKGSRL
jgi:hypothetical protein